MAGSVKPERKTSQSGSEYFSFSIAESIKSGSRDEAIWYKCVWINPANTGILGFLDKGSGVCMTGRLQKPKPFQRRDGTVDVDMTIFVTDVSFLPVNRHQEASQYKDSTMGNEPAPIRQSAAPKDEDEVPF